MGVLGAELWVWNKVLENMSTISIRSEGVDAELCGCLQFDRDPAQPRLQVIQGGGARPAGWLKPPRTVLGRSPFDRTWIMSYRVAEGDTKKQLVAGRRQPLFDLWWQVHGLLPPVPGSNRYENLARRSDVGISRAHACFRGIMRPAGADARGFDFVAFVTKPTVGFQYEPSMSCVIRPFEIATDLVFVTYARLDFPQGRGYGSDIEKMPKTDGVITHWHLVEADPNDPTMPIDHATRFRRRMW